MLSDLVYGKISYVLLLLMFCSISFAKAPDDDPCAPTAAKVAAAKEEVGAAGFEEMKRNYSDAEGDSFFCILICSSKYSARAMVYYSRIYRKLLDDHSLGDEGKEKQIFTLGLFDAFGKVFADYPPGEEIPQELLDWLWADFLKAREILAWFKAELGAKVQAKGAKVREQEQRCHSPIEQRCHSPINIEKHQVLRRRVGRRRDLQGEDEPLADPRRYTATY